MFQYTYIKDNIHCSPISSPLFLYWYVHYFNRPCNHLRTDIQYNPDLTPPPPFILTCVYTILLAPVIISGLTYRAVPTFPVRLPSPVFSEKDSRLSSAALSVSILTSKMLLCRYSNMVLKTPYATLTQDKTHLHRFRKYMLIVNLKQTFQYIIHVDSFDVFLKNTN